MHERIAWSKWHTSIPCIGESQMGKFTISDAYGNAKERLAGCQGPSPFDRMNLPDLTLG